MRRVLFILLCITLVSSAYAIEYEYYNRNAQYNAAHKYGGQVGVLSPGTSQGFGVLSALTNLEKTDSDIASGQYAIRVATLDQKAPTEAAVTSYVATIQNALQDSIDSKQNILNDDQLRAVNSGITGQKVENYDAYASQIAGKQDNISDLATIRSNAELAATAVQPGDLATVATTGDYTDLTNRPAIPTKTSDLTNDSGFLTQHQDISGKANIADLSTVATSGDYDDLLNKPVLGTAAGADASDFATSAQGTLADTAVQPGDNVSGLVNDAGYLTAHQSLSDLGLTATATELNYVDGVTSAIQTQIDSKQATISDLETIRSGASAGATAVQPGDLATVATTGAYSDLSGTPTIGSATLTIQKNGTDVDSFSANATSNKTINITVPTTASDISALPSSTKYGAALSMSIDNTTYVITTTLKDQDGNALGTAQTIDLPLETMVVGASYNDNTKKIILTLKNGNTVDFSVADLVSGLQSEITAQSQLSADLVDDTNTIHKFVSASDKTTWNSKVDQVATANRVYGTDANGAQTTYDKNSFGQVDDVKIGSTSVVSNKIASLGTMAAETASDYTKTSGLATVATSGSYTDLSNKPTIPAAQVNSDWNASSGVAQILNKPTLGTAAAADTTDFATSAQGGLADTAVQPGDNVSGLVNDAGYLTAHQTLSDLSITATATELNVLDGITATTTELNYVDGVTSAIQTQLNGKAATDDSKFNSMPTAQPSGGAGSGRAWVWVQ